MTGELLPGERLPNEALLAREFGVSRATIREALRVLAAQNLLRTAKGAGGGSYVTVPSVRNISDFLRSNIDLLTGNRDLTLEELIEARVLLEVPAARLAAERRSEDDLERLRSSIPPDSPRVDTREEFLHNAEFHTTLIESCGNTLLYIAAQPVFSALRPTSRGRSSAGAFTSRSTATTIGSCRRSRPVTRARRAPRCSRTSSTSSRSTRRRGETSGAAARPNSRTCGRARRRRSSRGRPDRRSRRRRPRRAGGPPRRPRRGSGPHPAARAQPRSPVAPGRPAGSCARRPETPVPRD